MTSTNERPLSEQITRFLFSRSPNSITEDQLFYYFGGRYSEEDIRSSIEKLVEENVLTYNHNESNIDNLKQHFARRKSLYLKEYPTNIPFQKEIGIGDKKVPRLLDGDLARAEDTNRISEVLSEYVSTLETKAREIAKKEIERVYRNVIVIFGIFVSIFSLVVIATDKLITIDVNAFESSWSDLFLKSFALVVPIGIILVLFIGLIWFIIRKR